MVAGGRSDRVAAAYAAARERYAEIGVDTEAAMDRLARVPVSLPCWQGDDVVGFEGQAAVSSDGGIRATGGHPGRARSADELRADLEVALACIPGRHRVNLHAMYGDFGPGRVDRDAIEPAHFDTWLAWARDLGVGLDFNATLFAHEKADTGFTLSSPDEGVRAFWREHVGRCRAIAAGFGRALGSPCVHNLWLPDGMKDACVDRAGYRARLKDALDAVYAARHDRAHLLDAVESKLFGLGSESFVVGSHEFYLGYAMRRGLLLCLDMGHFHPTESVADKVSALLLYLDGLLLHASRGVRWDSDHVPVLDDALQDVALEIVRADGLDRVHLAIDAFDASINRVAAWVLGARALQQALLRALLEPRVRLRTLEREGDWTGRLALLEHAKALPAGAVWDAFCARHDVLRGVEWLAEVRRHEREVLSLRQR